MKHVTLQDFLTDREIDRAIKLERASAICQEIIEPNLLRINRDLGQENDPMYLAYAVEYAIIQYKKLGA